MFRFCPHCAAPAPLFLNEKKIMCENCGFQIYHNTAAAVAVLIECGDRYILLKRGREPGKGLWDLPGGFIDPDETAEDACRREIREEIGVEIRDLAYLTSHPNTYPYKGITYKTCDLLFTARCDSEDFIRQEDEIDAIELVQKNSVPLGRFAFKSIENMLKVILPKLDN